MLNPKEYAQSRRGKRYLSRRDYKFGGKIGGKSVNKYSFDYWQNDPVGQAYQGDRDLIVLSEADQALKEVGEKLEIEKALGFEIEEILKFTNRHKKLEKVEEVLETLSTSKAFGSDYWEYLKANFGNEFTYYALPDSASLTSSEIASMRAHAQNKKLQQQKSFLAEFGLKIKKQDISQRVNLEQWLPHSEIRHGYARREKIEDGKFGPCTAILSVKDKTMNIVGIGVKASGSTYGYGRVQGCYTAPQTFQVYYRLKGQNGWYGENNSGSRRSDNAYLGPRNQRNEIAHRVDLRNVVEVKIVAKSMSYWGEKRSSDQFDSFEVFLYGSCFAEEVEDESEKKCGANGSIKNARESGQTVIIYPSKLKKSKKLKRSDKKRDTFYDTKLDRPGRKQLVKLCIQADSEFGNQRSNFKNFA